MVRVEGEPLVEVSEQFVLEVYHKEFEHREGALSLEEKQALIERVKESLLLSKELEVYLSIDHWLNNTKRYDRFIAKRDALRIAKERGVDIDRYTL